MGAFIIVNRQADLLEVVAALRAACRLTGLLNGRRVAFTRNERGFGRLCVVDVDSGRVITGRVQADGRVRIGVY